MRLISHNLDLSAATELVLFPNGAIDGNDVFLGSGRLDRMVFAIDDASVRPVVTVTVYDACIGNVGRAVRGGTALTDTYRVIAGGGVALGSQGDPYVEAAPNAQLTACRTLIDRYNIKLGTDPGGSELPFEGVASVMGMAIHLSVAGAVTGLLSVNAQFCPDIAGGTRKTRRDLAVPIGGNIPL